MAQLKLRTNNDRYSLLVNRTDDVVNNWHQFKGLEKLDDEDLGYILRTPELKEDGTLKRGSKTEKIVFNWCHMFGLNYSEMQDMLRDSYDQLTIVTLPEEEHPVIHEEEVIEFEEVNSTESLTFKEEVVACTVLAARYPRGDLNCKPNLNIVGPSTTDKSTIMNKFRAADLVNWIGRTTEHSGLPGRPNVEADIPEGWYARSNGRCIMVNEAANLGNEKHIDKTMGELADLTTMGFVNVHDPAGDRRAEADVTVIMAMTYYTHALISRASKAIGPRYLVLKTHNNRAGSSNSTWKRSGTGHTRDWYVNLIRTAALREVGEPTEEMINEAHEFSQMAMDAASVNTKYAKDGTNAMGGGRFGDMIVYLALMRGVLHNRAATVDDVSYFLPLMANVISFQNLWKEAYNQIPGNRPVDPKDFKSDLKLSAMGVLESVEEPLNYVKFTDVWYDFLTEVIDEMW